MAVTKYKAIKWVKAAFEIVIAIILIVFGYKILFGAAPSEASEAAIFQLLVALLWFLVIWCIIAAVRNIILSLRPEPKNSLVTLNEKIDALDRKLVTMGLASETIPDAVPPSPEELKKGRNKKIMVVAGIVAAIVVLAAVSMIFLLPNLGGGGNPAGGATPEDTLNALITAMNSKDANGVLSLTVFSFGDATMKSQFRANLTKMFDQAGASFHITMNSNQTKYLADLNASENSNLTGIQNEIQNRISKTVTASCMIVFNMTITTNQTDFSQDGNMPCFQIDGGWYILLDFGDGGPGDGGGDRQNPEQTFLGFIENLNLKDAPGAVSFTVAMFGSSMEQSQTGDGISSMWQNSASFNVVVNNHQVREWTMLTPTEQNNLSSIQGNVSSHYGVTITESCFIQYTITITNDSEPGGKQRTGDMPCFKIDEGWYLVLEEPSQGPSSFSVSFNQNGDATNWTLSVNTVNGPGPLATSSVYLTVNDSTSATIIGMQQLDSLNGMYMNWVTFDDTASMGELNSGDSIILDASQYLVGTEVWLTDSSGMQVYSHYIIK